MKARGVLLALCAVSAAMPASAQPAPDWFDAFRGRAYLQADTSWLAREKSAAPDSPPLFRARWVVLRFGGFTEKERPYWPYRNLLLVTMPSGTRYVLESSFGFVDESHLDEERPFHRVASEESAFEIWMSGTSGDEGTALDPAPCDGNRETVRARGGSFTFFIEDIGIPTVRTALAEIGAATFPENERRDLAVVLRTSLENNRTLQAQGAQMNLRDPLIAANLAMRDRALRPSDRTLIFSPDPQSPTDLTGWRALAHLPLELTPFPVLPPDPSR